MKKIYLEITPFFPTEESFRGPYIFDQVKAIERNGEYDVIVIKTLSLYDQESVQPYTYQGIKVNKLKVIDLPSSILPGLFKPINQYRIKRFIKDTLKIDMNSVEVIHSHVAYPAGALAVYIGKQFSIRSFVQHHGLDVIQLSNGRFLKGIIKEWNKKYIKKQFLKTVNSTDLNIGVSNKVLDELKSIKGFSNPHTYTLYNGVDTAKFYKKEHVERAVVFTIGCIGNFWALKDHMTLLKAVHILTNEGQVLIVKFVGSGSTLQTCKDYVLQHQLERYVEFLSEIDHIQLNDLYNSLDLFVLPSFYEALGCVYIEALQVGVPIIAVKGQGIEELIIDDSLDESLISPHDYVKLAELINLHINKPNRVNYDLNIDGFIKCFLKFIKKI